MIPSVAYDPLAVVEIYEQLTFENTGRMLSGKRSRPATATGHSHDLWDRQLIIRVITQRQLAVTQNGQLPL